MLQDPYITSITLCLFCNAKFNLQPLRGDWRQKVKAAQKLEQKKGQDPVKASKSGGQQKPPDLSKENQGLPTGWQAIWDQASQKVYFGNIITKVGQS